MKLHYSQGDLTDVSLLQGNDHQMMQFLPSTLRKQALQHIFMRRIKLVYLFKVVSDGQSEAKPGARSIVFTRFIDAFLTYSKIELYVTPVDIVEQGSFVGELMILTHGQAMVRSKVTQTHNYRYQDV